MAGDGGRESEGLKGWTTGQSSHCVLSDQPGRVCFLREEEDVQINRQRSQDSVHQTVSCGVSLSLSLSYSPSYSRPEFLCGMLWGFSQQCCLFACLGQPTYVAHSRRRVNRAFLLSLSLSLCSVCSSFSNTFSPIPKIVLRWLAPVRSHSACGIIFVRGAAFDCCAETLPHTMAPLFWGPQVSKLVPEPRGCRGVGRNGRGGVLGG